MKTTKVSILGMTFGAVVLIASIGVGFAQEHPVAPVNQSSLQTDKNRTLCASVEECADQQFHDSGTEGREGLGAEPAHPEGPGNVED